jgi:hypothetical protein
MIHHAFLKVILVAEKNYARIVDSGQLTVDS